MLSYALYAFVMIGVVVGYWWWTTGRHGGNAQKVYLGLRADEEIRAVYHGFFKLDFEKKDVALAVVGVERVGKALSFTLTQGGELVMRPKGDAPIRFSRGQLRLSRLEEGVDELVGASGQMEPADVYAIEPAGGSAFKVLLARSAADQLSSWAAAA